MESGDCIADFQIGSALKFPRLLSLSRFADFEIRDTADLEVGATVAMAKCVAAEVMQVKYMDTRTFR